MSKVTGQGQICPSLL